MRVWRDVVSNLSSALLALFLAVVVWVVAVYEKAPPRTNVFPTDIPIQILDLAENLVIASPVPTAARITVRALADTWEQLDTADFEATIDLLGREAGDHEVPVTVTTLQQGVSILDVEPDRVTVGLQELAERRMRVRVKVLEQDSGSGSDATNGHSDGGSGAPGGLPRCDGAGNHRRLACARLLDQQHNRKAGTGDRLRRSSGDRGASRIP